MQRSGCQLVEVGATNRTHLKDYAASIGDETALLMKVHTSNYAIEGFTAAVTEAELAVLAHANELPLVIDLGSGNLLDYGALGLPPEPTVAQAIQAGADLVTFSGDKLLGGPQCGIVAGTKDLVQRIRSHPLKRALRPDAMTYAALAEVLKLYRRPEALTKTLPSLTDLTRAADDIEAQADRLLPEIAACLSAKYQVSKKPCQSQIGSGAFPVESLASYAIAIESVSNQDGDLRRLSAALRTLPIPVISRLSDGEVLLDLRCLHRDDELLHQLPHLRDALC